MTGGFIMERDITEFFNEVIQDLKNKNLFESCIPHRYIFRVKGIEKPSDYYGSWLNNLPENLDMGMDLYDNFFIIEMPKS